MAVAQEQDGAEGLHQRIGRLVEQAAQQGGPRHVEDQQIGQHGPGQQRDQDPPGAGAAVMIGEADYAGGLGQEKAHENGEADRAMVVLIGHQEFEQRREQADPIADGQPGRAQGRALIGGDDPEGGREQTRHEDIDGQHEGGGAHDGSSCYRMPYAYAPATKETLMTGGSYARGAMPRASASSA